MQNRHINKATAMLLLQKMLKKRLLIAQRAAFRVKLLSLLLLLLTKQRCGVSALHHRAESGSSRKRMGEQTHSNVCSYRCTAQQNRKTFQIPPNYWSE